MVLYYPFVWPLSNAAENSQRQVCKQSLTLSESTTCDGLCSPSQPPASQDNRNLTTSGMWLQSDGNWVSHFDIRKVH